MSRYQFFASDKPLEEYDNQIIIFDRKKQVLKVKKRGLFSYDEHRSVRIVIEDDTKHMKLYTSKKHSTYIEWRYSDENAKLVIEYIRKNLKVSREIELWNVWLGDKENVLRKTCCIDNLEVSDIKNIWGKNSFEFPECLKIYRNKK